jgi:hypothetical protein
VNLLATWIPALLIALSGVTKLSRNPKIVEATELSHGALKANPFIPIVLLWIGAFIRDRSIFF